MKKFDIIRLKKQNMALVLILDSESPFSYLQEIGEELERSQYMGTVIIDELLHSGNNDERFILCNFMQGDFVPDSFQFYTVSKQDDIRFYMSNYLRQDTEGLNVSGLTSWQIGLIERGCVV